jgi:ArsR family transcriptional regulator
MRDLVIFAKALADETRVRILRALAGEELCVCELCDALETTQSTLSTHLQVLREAGLVQARRQGKWVYYAITEEKKRLADTLFGYFRDDLDADRFLKSDDRRLRKRLAEREDGACCRGFQTMCCTPLKPRPGRRQNRPSGIYES